MLHRLSFIALLSTIQLVTACATDKPINEEVDAPSATSAARNPTPAAAAPAAYATTDTLPPLDARTAEGMAEDEYMIGNGSVLGIRPGDPIDEVANTERTTLTTGEGDFTVYTLRDAGGRKLGYLTPHPERGGEVHYVTITDPTFVTAEQISVGSTWADLKAAYGDRAVVHGSETEGRSSVRVGKITYELDARFWTYEVDQGEVKDRARVTAIRVG